MTTGLSPAYCAPADGAATLWCAPLVEAAPGQHVIPLRVWWGERYLGQIRHALAVLVA